MAAACRTGALLSALFLSALPGAALARQSLTPVSPYASYDAAGSGSIGSAALSSDATRIAFLHRYDPLRQNPEAEPQLFVLGTTDTTLVQITRGDSLVDPKDPAFSLDGAWIYFTALTAAGTRELYRADPEGGTPERLTFQSDETGIDPIGRPCPLGPDGACFATAADLLLEDLNLSSREKMIYRVDGNGLLTRLSNLDNHPLRNAAVLAGSANGEDVIYMAEDQALPGSRPYRPFRLATVSGTVLPLTSAVGAAMIESGTTPVTSRFVFASTADYVGHSSSTTPQIYRVGLSGFPLNRLTQVQFTGAEGAGADSSGLQAVFESRASVLINETTGTWRVYTLNGNTVSRLSTGRFPVVSANAGRVAYVDASDSLGLNGDGSLEVFSVKPDGTDRRQHSRYTPGVSESPDISTNGEFIVFASTGDLTGENPDGSGEIFISRFDGTALTQLSHGASGTSAVEPAISSDGSWIVFASTAEPFPGKNFDGNYEIFRVDRDGSGLTQITETTTGSNRQPFVSEDGELVAFLSTANVIQGTSMGQGRVAVWRSGGAFQLVTASADRELESLQMDDAGERLALVTTANLGGTNPGHARRTFTQSTGGGSLASPGFPGGIHEGSFSMSPDGNWLGISGIDGILRVIPYSGGPADTVVSVPGVLTAYPSLSSGAEWISFSVLAMSGSWKPGDTFVVARQGLSNPVPLVEPAAPATSKPSRISGNGLRVAIVVTGVDSLNPDGSTEVFSANLGTTAARIQGLAGSRLEDGTVRIAWTAAVDAGHLQFRIGRSANREGPFQELPRAVEGAGPEYLFVDTAPPSGDLWYVLEALDRGGRVERFGPVHVGAAPVPDRPRLVIRRRGPASFLLHIDAPKAAHVRLRLYDLQGRIVDVLHDDVVPAGRTTIAWEGRNERGMDVASGVYYFRIDDQPARAVVLVR